MNNREQKFGRYGCVVEIHEAELRKRKYIQSRLVNGQWVLSGIAHVSKAIFVEPVESRITATTCYQLSEGGSQMVQLYIPKAGVRMNT